MASTPSIFLVGPMGAGKTTIGKALASALHMTFVDSDHEIEAKTGASVALIFDLEGEDGFRKRETAMIDELTQRQGIVLATGGGAVLARENQTWLAGRGITVFLHCSIDVQYERTRHDRNRPLLQTENPRERMDELMQEREPIYREIADIVVDSGGRNTRSVVKTIMQKLESDD